MVCCQPRASCQQPFTFARYNQLSVLFALCDLFHPATAGLREESTFQFFAYLASLRETSSCRPLRLSVLCGRNTIPSLCSQWVLATLCEECCSVVFSSTLPRRDATLRVMTIAISSLRTSRLCVRQVVVSSLRLGVLCERNTISSLWSLRYSATLRETGSCQFFAAWRTLRDAITCPHGGEHRRELPHHRILEQSPQPNRVLPLLHLRPLPPQAQEITPSRSQTHPPATRTQNAEQMAVLCASRKARGVGTNDGALQRKSTQGTTEKSCGEVRYQSLPFFSGLPITDILLPFLWASQAPPIRVPSKGNVYVIVLLLLVFPQHSNHAVKQVFLSDLGRRNL